VKSVDCQGFRVLISANLDGEATPLEEAAVSDHLRTCAECRRFEEESRSVVTAIRVGEAPVVPDQTAAILQSFDRTDVPLRVDILRVLVGTLGLMRIVTALGLFADAFAGMSSHAGTELAAMEVAIGFGLIFAAARPARSGALVVVLAVLALATVMGAVADVTAGRVDWANELIHVVDAVGAVLLWRLSTRPGSESRRRPITA
jgi:predicted anti-sigma-YlaC factor YlaD